MALGTDYAHQDCTLARALEVVGERWSLLLVRDAFYGVRRFNDFLVHLDIPRAVLTARLAALTEAGVLRKEAYQQSPPRYDYVLTDAGLELWPVVHGLAQWGGAARHTRRPAAHLPPRGLRRPARPGRRLPGVRGAADRARRRGDAPRTRSGAAPARRPGLGRTRRPAPPAAAGTSHRLDGRVCRGR